MNMQRKIINFLIMCVLFLPATAFAYEKEIHTLDIINHKFVPSIIETTQGKVIKLHIRNKDKTIEEFESFDLKREKIVAGNKKIVVTVGPLKPGEYKFFGEFHPETAQGKLVIK